MQGEDELVMPKDARGAPQSDESTRPTSRQALGSKVKGLGLVPEPVNDGARMEEEGRVKPVDQLLNIKLSATVCKCKLHILILD